MMKKLILISLLFMGCVETPVEVSIANPPMYKAGDVVYLKPDSTLGVVYSKSGNHYHIGYKNKMGEIIMLEAYENEIYGKK